MKAVVQRVSKANVTVNSNIVGEINNGFLIYICFEQNDTMETIDTIVKKIINLRVFEDSAGKMNSNILQNQGSILSISQFTLSWDGKKGHRPSFDKSMAPNQAKVFYRKFNDLLEQEIGNIQKGIFGAEMQVESINDGPVTFLLEY